MTATLEAPTQELAGIQALEINLNALQGTWTAQQYLAISGQTNHLLELTDGVIEELPMPTRKHQAILVFLYELLAGVVRPRGGKVFLPIADANSPRHIP